MKDGDDDAVLLRGKTRPKTEAILPSDNNAPTGIPGGWERQNPGKIALGWMVEASSSERGIGIFSLRAYREVNLK
jgi:hypothetical protein